VTGDCWCAARGARDSAADARQLFTRPHVGPRSPIRWDFFIPTQTQITTGGNANLDPEKSKTYSFGVVYKAVSGLSATRLLFGEIKAWWAGRPVHPQHQCAGSGSGFRGPAISTINPNAPFASLITRSAAGSVQTVASTNFNISARKTTGVDYAVTYVWPWRDFGRFTTRAD